MFISHGIHWLWYGMRVTLSCHQNRLYFPPRPQRAYPHKWDNLSPLNSSKWMWENIIFLSFVSCAFCWKPRRDFRLLNVQMVNPWINDNEISAISSKLSSYGQQRWMSENDDGAGHQQQLWLFLFIILEQILFKPVINYRKKDNGDVVESSRTIKLENYVLLIWVTQLGIYCTNE